MLGSLRTETAVALATGSAFALPAEAIPEIERHYPEVFAQPP